MKKRVLTGVIGGAIIILWLTFMHTPLFSAILALISVIGVYELIKAFEVKNIILKVVYPLIAAAIPFVFEYNSKLNIPAFPIITALVIFSLIIMVLDFKNLKFEQVACSLFATLLVPCALSSLTLLRDVYIINSELNYKKSDGVFLIIFAFFSCWLPDIFALFTGMKFGKHKLAPVISPKKTVEGAIGGIICSTAINIGLFFIFSKNFNLNEKITLPLIIISSIVLAVISIFGDLSASTIKRHHSIKDFGNLLPGHGGVMDRFDSSVFVFPALYSIITIINSI